MNYSTPLLHLDIDYDVYDVSACDVERSISSFPSTSTQKQQRKALVIVHGLLGSKTSWRGVAEQVAARTQYRVYCVSMRNHGATRPHIDTMSYTEMAHDLRQFIAQQIVERDKCACVALLGHSVGGKVAMATSLSDDLGLIKRLIVAESAPVAQQQHIVDGMKNLLTKLESIDLNGFRDIEEAKDQVARSLSDLREDLRSFLLTRLVYTGANVTWDFHLPALLNNVCVLMGGLGEFDKAVFHQPTLFVAGATSRCLTQRQDRPGHYKEEVYIRPFFADYRIVSINNTGHLVHLDNPEGTVAAICRFLE